MSVRRLDPNQPEQFQFTPDNEAWAEERIATFPEGKQASAVIQLLWRAQEQHDGWLPEPAIRKVAEMLDMPYIRVYEVATFYTMFQLSPVGRKAHVQVCGTTPCMLRGAGDLIDVCKRKIAAKAHEVSADGDFSWEEVECLGACVNAPMVQIWADCYEDLDAERFEALLDAFDRGEPPEPGPQVDRVMSAPVGGLTALTDDAAYESKPLPNLPGSEADAGKDAQAAADAAKKTKAGAGEPGGAAKGSSGKSNGRADAGTGAASNAAAVEKSRAKDAAAPGTPETPVEVVEEVASPDASGRDNALSGVDAASSAVPSDADLEREQAEAKAKLEALGDDATAEDKANAVGLRPAGLDGPRGGKPDDLKRISGIGPVNEDKLNELGVYHFEQIAAWDRPEILWTGTYLSFPGRIDRENWIDQARALASGEATEFSKRVDAGEVASSKDEGDD